VTITTPHVLCALLSLWVMKASWAEEQGTFNVPKLSLYVVAAPRVTDARIGESRRAKFAECAKNNSVGTKRTPHPCPNDPKHNTVLLALKSGVVLLDPKMWPDPDRSAYSRLRKGSDQPQTSLRYPMPQNDQGPLHVASATC
jgi:hypothetical protein